MPALKVTDLGDYLREQRQTAKLSLRQLAEAAGVSNPYLSQVERGLRRPSAEVLQQIAKGLQISAEALYVRAGILEERGDRVEVEAAILTDAHLSERQRRVLLDIYETFRSENERGTGDDATPQTPIPAKKRVTRRSTPKQTGQSTARTSTARKQGARKQGARKQGTTQATRKPTTKQTTSKQSRTTAERS